MTTTLLYGELRTGRITGAINVTGCSWAQTLNDGGAIDQVTVPEDVVRRLRLRQNAQAGRHFLAVEQDTVIREGGPIWSRVWDWRRQQLTLGAGGLWSLWDHRKVIPVLAAGQKVQKATTTVNGTDLGGIARALVAQAMTHTGGDVPVVLPAERTGTRTETFPGWKLLDVGDQLRELTKRETAAPDIAFVPRRRGDDPRYLEWVLEAGTEAAPQLAQVGADWVFDTTAPRGPVLGVGTDEDATAMGQRGWVTGGGHEEDVLIGTAYDPRLVDAGWPLLEVEESRASVEQQATVDGHSASLVRRSARPVEVWTVTVRADAARQVRPGHYARVVTRGDAWIPDGEHRMRVRRVAGDLDDDVTLHMYPLQAVI